MTDTARLIVALGLQDNLSGGLGRASAQLKGLESSAARLGKGFGQVGQGLDKIITRGVIAAGAGLGYVIKQAVEFDDSFAGVRKTVEGTAAEMDGLAAGIRGLARTIPVGVNELNAIAQEAGALGVAIPDLVKFTDAVARVSAATVGLSPEAAAEAFGKLGNVLHLTGEGYDRLASSLVALGNAGASSEGDIIAVSQRFGAAGSVAKLSAAQVLGFSSAIASLGVEPEAAGSSLSRLFNNITKYIGTASPKLEAFSKTAGLTTKQFKDLFAKDSTAGLLEFLKGLSKLDRFQQAAVLKKAGIINVRDINAVQLLSSNYGLLTTQIDLSSKAFEENTALSEVSNKRFSSVANQLKVLHQNLVDASITIGDALLPDVVALSKEFTNFLNKPETQARIKQFAKDLAGGVHTIIQELKSADFSGLIAGMKIAGEVAKTAFDMFNHLPPEIRALAIGALALNKVTGGGVGLIAKGLTNILGGAVGLGGGLLGRGSSAGNPVWVQSATGGVGGGPGGKGGLPWLAAITGLGTVALIESLIGEWAAQNIFRPMDPTKFDFNEVAGQSGKFSTANAANLFAQKLADKLGIPLDDVKKGIVAGVNNLGLTFDQAVSRLEGTLKPTLKPMLPGAPGGGHPGAFPNPSEDEAWLRSRLRELLPNTAVPMGADPSNAWKPLPPILTNLERLNVTSRDTLAKIREGSTRPAVVNVAVSVPVYVNASLIQAKIYQLSTFAKLREG